MKKLLILIVLTIMTISLFTACGQKNEKKVHLVFADLSWESPRIHNRIAAFIIRNAIGDYTIEYVPGDTIPSYKGLEHGDLDIYMQSWHQNSLEAYEKGIKSGGIIDIGENMDDAPQGWWIPRYMVEGDDAIAPNLKHIKDLPKYAQLFKDKNDPKKGIIYLGAAGWGATKISEGYFDKYGLDKFFNRGIPGSGTAVVGTMVGAYQKKQPWVGYYWAPSPVMAKVDMVLLKGSEFPKVDINKLVNKSMLVKAPEVVEFLKKFKTNVSQNTAILGEVANGLSADEAAIWFLKNYADDWSKWVTKEQAKKVQTALDAL